MEMKMKTEEHGKRKHFSGRSSRGGELLGIKSSRKGRGEEII
jgi:hypothetical protein